MSAPPRPKLRPVEAVYVRDPARGPVIVLRDTEGIAPDAVVVPVEWSVVLSRFDGRRSAEEIVADVRRSTGRRVDTESVAQLAAELDGACMLDSPRFQARRREVVQAFNASPVRPAAHAGGSYPGVSAELTEFIERRCLAEAQRAGGAASSAPGADGAEGRRLVGLCAPHMDLWRAAAGYGRAYATLARTLSSAEGAGLDTFVLLGTSHAVMRRPFAVCDKSFETPLGALPPDRAFIAELAEASRFDVLEDQYLHKSEHSLEFQVLFLQHLLGGRAATIVPILCGLPESQARGIDPARDEQAESFLRALGAAIAGRSGRIFVIAGADLAHVGPRFGDPAPLDARARAALERRDHESLDRAVALDPPGFFAHVVEDLDTRRVCGLGPIYTLLRALPTPARGSLINYTQCVDPKEGSIVSHASIGFYANA